MSIFLIHIKLLHVSAVKNPQIMFRKVNDKQEAAERLCMENEWSFAPLLRLIS